MNSLIVSLRRGTAFISAVLLLASSGAPLALAQDTLAPDDADAVPSTTTVVFPAGTTDCFAYYRFGSVQVNVSSSVTTAVSGTPITFTGAIKNDNPYPIVDGALYIKVFRLKDNSGAKDPNGPDVVDQFFVRSGINLPAQGSLPIAFTWDIPSYASTGDYKIATFFTTSKKYNLLGLSFTDDVVGNTASFHVSGEQQKLVSFDKNAVTVAGNTYYFAAFPPRTDKVAAVPISAVIRNTTAQKVLVPVSWKLYTWDAGQPGNLVAQSDSQVSVPAGGSATVSYTATDARYPVYLLIGWVGWGNTQSIINVRFARTGIDRTRINFPGVTAFPLRKGEETTLFSCLHNSGESESVPNGKLVLHLSDTSGKLIHEYTYTGDVTGDMMGVAEKFTPKGNYDTFELTAKLYQGGTLVDESLLTYDCNQIAPSTCLPKELKSQTFSLSDILSPSGLLKLTGVIALLALLVVSWLWVRRRNHASPLEPTL
ncbi:MAG: hypothetical protein Q7S50_02020 [bacterium]|nr:hypothetical protein [bacterium]